MNTEINLHTLPKITTRRKKRVGRGYGSGKGGHTSGRGQKGQRSRRTIPWWFEGGQLPLVRRVPFWRGKGRLNPLKNKPAVVKTGDLDKFPDGATVSMKDFPEAGNGIKILAGGGELTKTLTIEGIPMSAGAREIIERAGKKSSLPRRKAEKSKAPKAK